MSVGSRMSSIWTTTVLIPRMRRDREDMLTKAGRLRAAGFVHASNRYMESADRIRRAIENIEHEESVREQAG